MSLEEISESRQIAKFAVNKTRHCPDIIDGVEAMIDRLVLDEREKIKVALIHDINRLGDEFDIKNVRIIIKNFTE